MIYIALTTWDEQFVASTATGTFVDFNSEEIIAYGSLSAEEASRVMNSYDAFEIDLVYRNLEKIPTHILVVASASKYGDYFTGGNGSTLYIDEFELDFDYNAASFE
ncbi:MAG: PCMD domain-containing protein [Tannerellaceae bacterium]|nr:PCMD domain-containing protein [Tannerellaceae bacterium]